MAFREEDLRSGVSQDGRWAWVPLTVPVSGHIARAKGIETRWGAAPYQVRNSMLGFMSSSWKSAPEAKLSPSALTRGWEIGGTLFILSLTF